MGNIFNVSTACDLCLLAAKVMEQDALRTVVSTVKYSCDPVFEASSTEETNDENNDD